MGMLIHIKYKQGIGKKPYIIYRTLQVIPSIIEGRILPKSVYTPHINKQTKWRKNYFYKELQGPVDQIEATDKIITMRDLNARIGNDLMV